MDKLVTFTTAEPSLWTLRRCGSLPNFAREQTAPILKWIGRCPPNK